MTRPHVNEFRALRDGYGRKVVAAMAKRFPAGKESAWQLIVDDAARQPYGPQAEALRLYQENTHDMEAWAAIDRFLFSADKVWEAESDAMMNSQPYARHNYQAA